MTTTHLDNPLTTDQLDQWGRDGYLIVSCLFSDQDVQAIRTFFDDIATRGEATPFWKPNRDSDKPLERYPRAMHPHRWDDMSKAMMLKPQVGAALEQLMGEPAVACQSMYYFKPPQSPGQSLHQDNFYLAVKPGTCVAAWTAIDPAYPDNGGLYVVPGSHKLDIHCPDPEHIAKMGTTNLIEPPKGMKAVPAELAPGDTLFFNGSVIHGSGRNKTRDQWRRSFICHYMPASSTHVNEGYFPIHDFQGNVIEYEAAAAGGPCGYGDEVKGIPTTYGLDAVVH